MNDTERIRPPAAYRPGGVAAQPMCG